MIIKFWKSILWAGIIAFLLLIPGDRLPGANFFSIDHLDKIVHFVLFAMLELLILGEIRPYGPDGIKRKILSTALATGYALLTEFLQFILSLSRSGSWIDFLADAAGLATGFVIFGIYMKIRVRAWSRK